jgi:hypothetical protein
MTGSLADAINSDICTLTLSGGELVTLFDIMFSKTIPRNRRSTRAGKLDTWGPPLEELSAKCTCDKATANVIEALTVLSATLSLTKESVTITGKALSGAGQNMVATGTAEFFDYKIIGPEGGRDVTIEFSAVFDNDLNIAA